MDKKQRILKILENSENPVKGKILAEKIGISRQMIIQYISRLKSDGHKIIATRDGYILEKEVGIRKMIAVKHSTDEIENELFAIVQAGGKIIDVIVEHPLYGEIKGRIDVKNEEDIIRFMSLLKTTQATPLLELSDGVHIHTIEVKDEKSFEKIKKAINKYLILDF
ncbi:MULTISPECIES: transcription repressor NadR [unclassified Marinitoga]|uniref:transcription repressor NadR n=1 Tax=unclassified Marinitoga TaxID=2640159 RepID=UPI000659434F|nr:MULTISPECIES: transcription repressor NadR [unclassified Marinitoga]KLO25014.1 transcriptional regulator [Marinitoga sp. 1155]